MRPDRNGDESGGEQDTRVVGIENMHKQTYVLVPLIHELRNEEQFVAAVAGNVE